MGLTLTDLIIAARAGRPAMEADQDATAREDVW